MQKDLNLNEFYVSAHPKDKLTVTTEQCEKWERELTTSLRHDPSALVASDIPPCFGVYAWINKATGAREYIGKSTGKTTGLRTRIVKQHLNKNYLEPRSDKHSKTRDSFQLNNPVYDSKQRIVIDKSAFRKNIARKHKIQAGKDSVDYICNTFELVFIALPDQTAADVKAFENWLIQKHKPVYNTQ